MKDNTGTVFSETESLKNYLKNNIIVRANKLRGRHTPISEIVNNVPKTLKIKDIYNLQGEFKRFYLFVSNNYTKNPKTRYFLAVSLASQSSDLLVSVAKEFPSRNPNYKLIQYSLYPNTLRVNLLLLKEYHSDDLTSRFKDIVEDLKKIRKEFREKLDRLKTLL